MPKARRRRVKTPPFLFDRTQAVLKKIQAKVDGALLTYWTSTSGSVCDNDVMALHELLQGMGPQPRITLLVKSDGGSGMAARNALPNTSVQTIQEVIDYEAQVMQGTNLPIVADGENGGGSPVVAYRTCRHCIGATPVHGAS